MILDTSVYNESNIESTANIEKDIMYRIKDIFNDISTCDIRTFNNHVDFMRRIFMKDQKHGNMLNNNGNSDIHVPSSLDFIFNVIFSYYGKNIPAKIIIFLRKIFLHKEEINNAYKNFVENNINYLLSCIESKKKRTRQRVIILLDLILTSISNKEDECGNDGKENIFLEYLFSETDILLKVSERLFDNETIIRKEAIKLLEPYQERKINSRTKIGSIFKDLLKFDPSPEIRKLVFKTLKDFDFESNISKTTLNLLIERSKDVNPGVRRIFYTKLRNIALKEIDQEQRINILYSAYYDSKNNIDSSNIKFLVEKIIPEYNLPDEFIILIEHFYNREKLSSDSDTEIDCLKYLLELLFSALGDNILTFDETYLSNINIYSIYLMDAYLSFIEKEYSRDNLPLPSLDNYASLLYLKCKDIINTYNKESENTNTTINSIITNSSNNMYYITMLFNILKYYDFFSEENNKLILVTIYRILTQIVEEIKIEKIVEESVKISIILLYNNYTPDNKLYNFLGSIIKKNNENNNKSIILSKYILKHIKYDIESKDMHEAIIKEIIQPLFQNNIFSKNIFEEKIDDTKILGLECLFYYSINRTDINTNFLLNILTLLENNNRIEFIVDTYIYLFNKTEINKLDNILDNIEKTRKDSYIESTGILDNSYSTDTDNILDEIYIMLDKYFKNTKDAVALSKLLMINKFTDNFYIILQEYCRTFKEKDILLNNYIDTFITEYANNYNINFNNIFLEAIPRLNNCNINNLMNKYMQWNNKPTEDIFYKILLMMYKYKESIKYYILILNKIDIESMYENSDGEYDNMNNKAYLKRLVYLTTLISKNVSNRSKVVEVLQRLMDLDDGEPINKEDVERVKNDIKE